MDKNLFKLSDSAKCDLLWDALNANSDSFTIVCDIYDDYAIGYDTANRKYLRAFYTKDDAANTVTIDRTEDCYIVDVSEAEMTALNAMKAIGSYTEIENKLNEQQTAIDTFTVENNSLTEQLNDAKAELEEYKKKEEGDGEKKDGAEGKDGDEGKKDGEDDDKKKKPETDNACNDDDEKKKAKTENALAEEIESYKSQLAEKDAEIARLNNSISDINNEKSELESFKKAVDTEKKTDIIKEFSASLTEEQVAEFTGKMDDFSVEDFKKEVCFAAYNANASILAGKKAEEEPGLMYKMDQKDVETGALALLKKHKGGNK